MKANAARLMPLLLLLTLPATVRAQFTYTTSSGSITITHGDCSGGTVVIPDTIDGLPVTGIDSYAFLSCYGLTNLTIADSITRIGEGAFVGCTGLSSIAIGNGVTSIGYYAFSGCTNLSAINVAALNPMYSSVDGVLFNKTQSTLVQYPGGKTGDYTTPNRVITIGYQAFSYCTLLTKIMIPNSVTRIGETAFIGCTGLSKVTIGNGVTTIADHAFFECTTLSDIMVPNSVISIGKYAFSSCTGMKTATIGNSVTTIKLQTFSRCTALSSVTLGDRVTSIGNDAFTQCTNLISITLPNSLTTIGSYAFFNCSSLTSITIPNGVTSIGDLALVGCPSLLRVNFKGEAPIIDDRLFIASTNATVYYLPETAGWSPTFAGRPTALWLPQPQSRDASFGVRTNQFGFNVVWASGKPVVVEASTGLVNSVWVPLQTNTLNGDLFYFIDLHWTNHSTRFYRVRSL